MEHFHVHLRLDGGGGTPPGPTVRVYMIPVTAGLDAVEAAFDAFVGEHPGVEWGVRERLGRRDSAALSHEVQLHAGDVGQADR